MRRPASPLAALALLLACGASAAQQQEQQQDRPGAESAAPAATSATAADTPPIPAPAPEQLPPVQAVTKQLYEDALQSIAEGRKQDANQALRRVIEQEPQHAGAWLDLALIQCSLGRPDEAERMFRTIEERFAPPPGIVELIREARAVGCEQWTPLSQYNLSISRGIDQNVNQGSTRVLNPEYTLSPEFQPQHDQYTMLSGDYMRDLTPNGTVGFVQFQQRRNDTLRQYDSGALFAGAETLWRWDGWTLRGTVLAGLISLGGEFYQRQYQLLARVGPPLKLPYGFTFHLQGSVGRNSYVTLDTFDANTGELRAQFSRRKNDSLVSASIGVATDRATGARPGGDRHGANAALSWQRKYATGLTAEVGYTLQHWRGSEPYAPPVVDQVREQDTHTLRAALTYPVARQQNLILEVRQVINRENIPIFQYNNRQLQLSWQWQGL